MLFTFFLRYLAVQHEHHWRTAGVLWALVDSCFCCAPFLQSWTQNRWRLRGNHRDKVWTPSQHRGGLFYYTTNSSWGVTCADTHALGGLILRVGTQLSFRASSYCALSSEKACPVTSPNGTNLKRRIWWTGEGLSGNIIDTPSRKKFVEE